MNIDNLVIYINTRKRLIYFLEGIAQALQNNVIIEGETILNKYFSPEEQELLKSIDPEPHLKLEEIRKQLNNVKTVVIYTAIPITVNEEHQITKDLYSKLKPEFIVDFKIKPSVLAGAIVEFDGKVHDYSLHKKITDNKYGKQI